MQADHRALATALYWRAVCEFNLGLLSDGRRTARRTLELARKLAERQTEFLALRILAITQASLPGFRDEAIDSGEAALAIVREFDQPAWELEVMHTVAHVANLTGRHQEAIDLSREALGLREKLGVGVENASWLGIVGDANHGLGRYREAAEALLKACPIFRDHFMRRHQALCLLKVGYAYLAMGDYQAALINMEESLPIFHELRLTQYEQRVVQTIDSCRLQLQASGDPLLRGVQPQAGLPTSAKFCS
jgi:tetratricopeptide (TPR) repeat protein